MGRSSSNLPLRGKIPHPLQPEISIKDGKGTVYSVVKGILRNMICHIF